MEVILGHDTGNAEDKTRFFRYISGMQVSDIHPAFKPDPSDMLIMDGKFYTHSNERIEFTKNKALDQRFCGLMLMGIAKEIMYRNLPQDLDIILAVGLPPGDFKNPTLKADLVKYKDKSRYHFRCADREFNLRIKKVLVSSQGLGAVFTVPLELRTKSITIVIDIGGYTLDIILMRNGKPDPASIKSLPGLGIIDLYNTIIEAADSELDIQLTEQHICDVISGTEHYISKEGCDLINRCAEQHMKKILNSLAEKKLPLSTSFVLFVGGGSMFLQKWIEQQKHRLGGYHVVTNANANAIGYEEIAARRYFGKSYKEYEMDLLKAYPGYITCDTSDDSRKLMNMMRGSGFKVTSRK